MSNEADARIIIDRLLREADWDIEDTVQVSAKEAVAGYVLKDSRSRLLAFIEAKCISIDRVGPKREPLVVIEVVTVSTVNVVRNGLMKGAGTRSAAYVSNAHPI